MKLINDAGLTAEKAYRDMVEVLKQDDPVLANSVITVSRRELGIAKSWLFAAFKNGGDVCDIKKALDRIKTIDGDAVAALEVLNETRKTTY